MEYQTVAAVSAGWGGPLSDILVRRMTMDDVEQVCAVDALCYATPWHSGAYITELTNRHATYFTAECRGQLVGYSGMWVVLDEAQITTIAVHPEFRGRRIARLLFHMLMESGRDQGATRASLEVRERNAPAIAVYRRYGFQEAALRRNYYQDTQENGLVMWREGMRETAFAELLQRERELLRNGT
jgi:ribosomal-protein-alanine N-acetyltransferase